MCCRGEEVSVDEEERSAEERGGALEVKRGENERR